MPSRLYGSSKPATGRDRLIALTQQVLPSRIVRNAPVAFALLPIAAGLNSILRPESALYHLGFNPSGSSSASPSYPHSSSAVYGASTTAVYPNSENESVVSLSSASGYKDKDRDERKRRRKHSDKDKEKSSKHRSRSDHHDKHGESSSNSRRHHTSASYVEAYQAPSSSTRHQSNSYYDSSFFSDARTTTLVRMNGMRQLTLGLATLALWWRGESRLVGFTMLAGVPILAVDGWVTRSLLGEGGWLYWSLMPATLGVGLSLATGY